MSRLKKQEQLFEKRYERLLELYVPIRYAAQKDIEIVFEIYKNLDSLYIDIYHNKRIIWISIILGFIILYFLLFCIVWNASKRIVTQNKMITESEVN